MVKEKSVIIVGAGIAGSCTAYHLNQAGWDINLIDEKKENQMQIYLNPAICVYPKIMLNDSRFNELMNLSIKYVWKLVKKINLQKSEANMLGAIHLYQATEGQERYAKLMQSTLYSAKDIELIPTNEIKNRYGISKHVGFYFKNGGWIKPKSLCQKLIKDSKIKAFFGSKVVSVRKKKGLWTVMTENKKTFSAPKIIFCSASDIKNYKYFEGLDTDEYRGQINWLENEDHKFQEILSKDGYVIPNVDNQIIFGSSYEKNNLNTEESHADTLNNFQKLKTLKPNMTQYSLKKKINSWVGQRAASYDKKPYVGRVLKFKDKSLSPHNYSTESLDWHEGLFVNACYGSRGFSFAPLASLSLSRLITGNTHDDDKFILNYLNPERKFFKRQGIKKKGVKFNS